MEHFFPPISIKDLRSDADQSQIIGGDAVKLLGWYTPPGFSTPDYNCSKT